MKLNLYQVDAFTKQLFAGNPAAVCPLDSWIDDSLMQQIAAENNLAETAFIVKNQDRFNVRWFTPTVEVDLCGHATLASAYIIFTELGYNSPVISFQSHRSGELKVTKEGEYLTLNFPADKLREVGAEEISRCGFSAQPKAVYKGKTDYLIVFENEEQVRALDPDFQKVKKIPARGIIVTAPGNQVDFVSRFFAPQSGIPEDPVTGSAHTSLIPYWSKRLNKKQMTARQLSIRGGDLICADLGDRVGISGQCVLYLKGEIFCPDHSHHEPLGDTEGNKVSNKRQ